MMRGFLAILIAGSLGACSTVRSTNFETSSKQGIPYNLAVGSLQLSIVDSDGALSIAVAGPFVSADPQEQMIAMPMRSGLADNNVTITVDPKTNLLLKVDSTSTGRFGDIAKKAARSLAFQSAIESVGTPIFKQRFNPLTDDVKTINVNANAALQGYFDRRCTNGVALAKFNKNGPLAEADYTKKESNAAMVQRLLRCRALEEAGVKSASAGPISLVKVQVDDKAVGKIARNSEIKASAAQCKRGVCFRPFRPLKVSLSLGNYYSQSDVMLIPDTSRLAYVDLASGVFAKQMTVANFTDGMLTSLKQDSGSELLGLVSLPADIAAELIKAPAEALGLKKTALAAETSYLAAVRANATEQDEAQKVCKNNPGACPETAYKVIKLDLTDAPKHNQEVISQEGDNTIIDGGAGGPVISEG